MNLRPSGYEPDELPDCSTPRHEETDINNLLPLGQRTGLIRKRFARSVSLRHEIISASARLTDSGSIVSTGSFEDAVAGR